MHAHPFSLKFIITIGAIVFVAFLAALSRRNAPTGIWGRLCSGCGTYIPNFARFCPHCGRRADQK
jgi:hypothetical protein